MATFINSTQVKNIIKAGAHARTVFINGETGVGKTAIFHELKRDPVFANHHFVDPIDCSQLDLGSIWMPDLNREAGVSRELPNERFGINERNCKGVDGAKPVMIFLDELGKSKQFIKDMLAPVIYDRRLGRYHLPEGSVVLAATNLAVEGLGDDFQPHLRSRVTMLYMRKPTQKEWVQNFAVPRGLDPVLIAATEQMPKMFDSFIDYDASFGGAYASKNLERDNPYIFNPKAHQDGFVSPRTLHAASDWMKNAKANGMDDVELQAVLEGTLGAAGAEHIMATKRFGNQLPSLEYVLAEPDKAPIPESPVAQIVQVFQFVTQIATKAEVDKVMTYVARLKIEMQGLLANYVCNSSGARIQIWASNKAFGKSLIALKDFA